MQHLAQMSNQALVAIGLIAIIIALRALRHTGKLFVIRIKPAKVQQIKGKVPQKTIEDFKAIIRKQRVYGTIWGTKEEN